jgi:hypothetical protein
MVEKDGFLDQRGRWAETCKTEDEGEESSKQ